MSLRRLLFGPAPSAGVGYSLGLLLLRVSVGGMMLLAHGWGKLTSFAERSSSFPDPLGVGSSLSMALATGAEAFCALAVILGFATRWACRAAHGHHASSRAYHTRGRPVGEKGVRAVVLFPLCDVVSNGRGTLLARRLLPARRTLSQNVGRLWIDAGTAGPRPLWTLRHLVVRLVRDV